MRFSQEHVFLSSTKDPPCCNHSTSDLAYLHLAPDTLSIQQTRPFSSNHLEAPRQRRRLIPQHLVDLGHDLVGQLRHDFQRLDRVGDLLDLARARDRARHVRVLDYPRQGQRRLVAAQLLRDRRELPHLRDLALPLLVAVAVRHRFGEVVPTVGVAAVGGDGVVVFSCQDPRFQGREDGQADAVVFVEEGEFFLDFVAGQHVVLGLFDDGADQVEAVGVGPGDGDFFAVPFGLQNAVLVQEMVVGELLYVRCPSRRLYQR